MVNGAIMNAGRLPWKTGWCYRGHSPHPTSLLRFRVGEGGARNLPHDEFRLSLAQQSRERVVY